MTFYALNGDCRMLLRELRSVVPSGSTIITDPPYSDLTHTGRRTGSDVRQSNIKYQPLTPLLAADVMVEMAALRPQFIVIFSDDETSQWWKVLAREVGYYPFAPIPWVKPDPAPRMAADGPASGTERILVSSVEPPEPPVEWINVARWPHWPERRFSRPHWYNDPTSSTRGNGKGSRVARPGTKPLSLCRKLVRDYATSGSWVIDPFMGTGPVLQAAFEAGCTAWGCDIDSKVVADAHHTLTQVARQPALIRETPPVQLAIKDSA